jgi:hypothetical protein
MSYIDWRNDPFPRRRERPSRIHFIAGFALAVLIIILYLTLTFISFGVGCIVFMGKFALWKLIGRGERPAAPTWNQYDILAQMD